MNDTITGAVVTISAATFVTGDVLDTVGTLPAGISASYSATSGVLTLSGTAPRTAYAAALAQVRYHSTSVDPTGDGTFTSRTVTFTVTDNGPTPNTSAAVSRTLGIVAVNQPPVITVPTAIQFVNEDAAPGGPLVFSAPHGNAISVADPNPVLVLLSATNGTLTLGTVSGLSFLSGDGTADAGVARTGRSRTPSR